MRVILLGTPEFAVDSLEKLIKSPHELIAVVSQPDRARDRRGTLLPTPVKAAAQKYGIKVFQFDSLNREGIQTLKDLKPDIMVTAAYGQLLNQEVLDIAPYGVINVHGSLLPKYRGAAPVQWAIINGETQTGVTVMQTALGLDCGDILSSVTTKILPDETSGQLMRRLAVLGADLLAETLTALENGKITPQKQDETQATKCAVLKKQHGLIDWEKPAKDIVNHVRGMTPWPSAYTFYNGKMLKILSVRSCNRVVAGVECGMILSSDRNSGLVVAAGKDAISILSLQAEGGKPMEIKQFLAGNTLSGRLGGEVST